MVHSRDDMSNVHKLYYLKEAMVSGAEELLRDFEINESSYLEAWSYLILGFETQEWLIRLCSAIFVD